MVAILAFNMIDACILSEIDEKFVLTVIDCKTGKESHGEVALNSKPQVI